MSVRTPSATPTVCGVLRVRVTLFPKKALSKTDPKHTLSRAIKARDYYRVSCELLSKSADLNHRNKRGETPLYRACEAWENERILLDMLGNPRVEVNISNADGNTPLHWFCSWFASPNYEDALNGFIMRNADINAVNKFGETPLHKAVLNKNIRLLLVSALLEHGAEVNRYAVPGGTALHYAVQKNRADLVAVLLQYGADPYAKDSAGQTPVEAGGQRSAARALRAYMDLGNYLNSIGFGELKSVFIGKELTLETLPLLDEQQLVDWRVSTAGGRLRLLQQLRKLPVHEPREAHASEPVQGDPETLCESDIEFTSLLGRGTSGKVYKGLLHERRVVAVKVLNSGTEKERADFEQEFKVIRLLASKAPRHIVDFYGAICGEQMSGRNLCIVMEYCELGSLYDVLNTSAPFGWGRMLRITEQLLRGLWSLHSFSPQILHRDLKSANILVKCDDTVKLCDFGLSRFDTVKNFQTLVKLRGTYAYTAPEVYNHQKYTPKSDMFSVGIIMWEMCYRCVHGVYQRPYAEYPGLQMDFQIIIQTAKHGLRPTIPSATPRPLAELVKRCLLRDQDRRPTADELADLVGKLAVVLDAPGSGWDESA